ncbi:hypothetical protein C494_02006 [Natronorubrum bangense JCM 10635]|uniref:Uncharacterized protein n=1 Tax=Natronorubrum bangense JCM 10635 TaxID=1227500 RepID=L9WU47_9EURY|nr:hypothetical protein C494_02006 [Natronorubrum bangense JCM 10635]
MTRSACTALEGEGIELVGFRDVLEWWTSAVSRFVDVLLVSNDLEHRDFLDVTHLRDEQAVFTVDKERVAVSSAVNHYIVDEL